MPILHNISISCPRRGISGVEWGSEAQCGASWSKPASISCRKPEIRSFWWGYYRHQVLSVSKKPSPAAIHLHDSSMKDSDKRPSGPCECSITQKWVHLTLTQSAHRVWAGVYPACVCCNTNCWYVWQNMNILTGLKRFSHWIGIWVWTLIQQHVMVLFCLKKCHYTH